MWMKVQRNDDAGLERCRLKFRDVDLGSEMWMQVQRCGCRFREMLMQVQRDTDAGFRDVDTGSVRC
jgi:hypothetical protein